MYDRFRYDSGDNNVEFPYIKFDELYNSNDIRDEIHLMISLLGRVRNNLFHGLKNISELDKQIDLFMGLEEFMILSLNTFFKEY